MAEYASSDVYSAERSIERMNRTTRTSVSEEANSSESIITGSHMVKVIYSNDNRGNSS